MGRVWPRVQKRSRGLCGVGERGVVCQLCVNGAEGGMYIWEGRNRTFPC